MQDHLSAALTALARLDQILAILLEDDAPSFDDLRELIENILLILASEVRKRGAGSEPAAGCLTATGVRDTCLSMAPLERP